MAATRPMLRAAACALAAKHLHRLCQGDSVRISQLPHLRKSPLQWIIRAIDWKYESVRLYDQAIHHLKEAIALEIPDDRREEMFAVVAILGTYELSDAPSTEWRAHLSALPYLYCGSSDAFGSTETLPDSLLHISRSVFWSLYRQDCLSAFINETQTRLDLSDLILWRNLGLSISSYGHLLPPSKASTTPAVPSTSPSPHVSSPTPWLDEATLSNALIWLTGKIINYITSGDGINPGDYESPPDQRPSFGTTQEDLLKRWQRLDFELRAWHDTLPASFTPCVRTRLSLSTDSGPIARRPAPEHRDTDASDDNNPIDAIVFTVPMCAVTIQTYHMARILLLSNMPQEATAIRSTVTARLHNYRRIAGEVVRHAREVCGISLAGLPDAMLPQTVQPLFVAGQCFEGVPERRLVVDLLRRVECETTWATEYRVQDLRRQMDTGIIGSVVVMQQFTQKFGSFSSIVHGLVVSAILIPAAFSSFFGGKLADWVGRPRAISLGALIFGVGAAIEAGAVHLAMFIVGRVVEGLGEGLYLGTLVVYICEISPPKQRGPLTTGPQLFVTVGLVVGFFTCYGCERLHSSMAWRTPFTLLAGVSVLFGLAAFLWLPESPRWLTLHNRSDEATRAWEYLQVSPADREELSEEDDYDVHEEAVTHPLAPTGSTLAPNTLEQVLSQRSERSVPEKGGHKTSLFDAFKPDVRNRTFLGLFLMSMQQLAGIDGVLYYAPLLFEQAGMTSDQASFLASGVSGIVIFAVTVPALIYADSWGRRHNVILGGLGLAATMLVIGALYAADAVHESTGAGRWVVIVAIYLFAAIYSVSWAVSCKIYAAEIQPQRTRASATCLAHGANWISNFFVALITPVLLAKSSCAAYFLFGGCTLVTAAVCWVWMPETKGKSLEEVERSFVRGKRG
ncbi:uncharacterized protein BO72DRAFT_480797 [Aspergillus fijiensis CBS 313.89]|uniref:Major facilitator superfamily (MFS) profile domain-containing protein n=1 Tax=Aspergillus fijiensis CBS 313.89 TaxID=1448319 RepID=A0A8G1VU32_9EURO|nr:uncharacterized protein BO72DRAFT_480797 [Aspergillus fijiensis CBS 313.89]RAK72707.1 hypothetical protein BO72DRAFT_480797 [Aspergillus fijiensis CBS 313.89]